MRRWTSSVQFMMVMSIMHQTNIDAMDLNLLRVLDGLLAERNLTRAARRLGLSQPATSHALGRLRAHLGDPLFVRVPNGLDPTPRALQLAAPVRSALASLGEALRGAVGFEPASAQRRFVLGTADYGAFVLVPPLLERVERQAPGIDLWTRVFDDDPHGQLAAGEFDVAIGPLPPRRTAPASVHARLLFEERFVCVVRKDHPRVKRTLDLETYASLSHLLIAPRGTPGGIVDDVLARHGKRRRVAIGIPHFLLAPHIIANSDLVVTLGVRVAEVFAKLLPVRILPPPVPIPGFKVHMTWHDRHDHDPAQRWLRDQLVQCVAPEKKVTTGANDGGHAARRPDGSRSRSR